MNIFAKLTLNMTSIDLLKFMLPDFLIENFKIVSTTNSEERDQEKKLGRILQNEYFAKLT
jgi:hypothetical protein